MQGVMNRLMVVTCIRLYSCTCDNHITVSLMLTLLSMNSSWVAVIIDFGQAFLQGKFENREELYIEVWNRLKDWYPGEVVLKMNVPLYGTK